MTNNSSEYEALILGLRALLTHGAQSVVICGDSQLVINQVLGIYECRKASLLLYRQEVVALLNQFIDVVFDQVR